MNLTTVLLCLGLSGAGSPSADTAVVCPAEFRAALQPWIEHRRAQGHRIAIISNLHSPDELRSALRRIAAGGRLRYLLLVGDADPRLYTDDAMRRRSVPGDYTKAVVNLRFGSTDEIATDNTYADLDGDRVPDIAVGRLPCDTADELAAMVDKILAYERSADFGPWRRSVHVVAGLGGFGAVADAALEAAAKSLLSEGIAAPYSTTMTYGSWQSPYCPDPRDFNRVTLGRLNEGSLFWVYIGHGQPWMCDEVRVPGGTQTVGAGGTVYDIAHMQFFQGDQIRGRGGLTDPADGRRVLAQVLHDTTALTHNPPNPGGPAGSTAIFSDGSVAAFVPARRALAWHATAPNGTPVIRERYWITLQPGEIRACDGCHGVNQQNQAGQPASTQVSAAFRDLLNRWNTQVGSVLFANGFEG